MSGTRMQKLNRNLLKKGTRKSQRQKERFHWRSLGLSHEMLKRNISHFLKEKEEIFLEIGARNKKGENGWLTIDMKRNSRQGSSECAGGTTGL